MKNIVFFIFLWLCTNNQSYLIAGAEELLGSRKDTTKQIGSHDSVGKRVGTLCCLSVCLLVLSVLARNSHVHYMLPLFVFFLHIAIDLYWHLYILNVM